MQTPTIQEITLENLDSFDYLDKNKVKNFVRDSLKNLSNYSNNEESILISLATGLTSTQIVLFNSFDRALLKKIKRFLTLRLKNMPLNKIAKSAVFYKDIFYINNSVLAPRQETELLVEKVINYVKLKEIKDVKILDLCCGSGAIGLSCAKYIEDSKVTLLDVSPQALKVAKKNEKLLKLKNTTIIKSDMFEDLKNYSYFDIIISNPPYIKTKEITNLDECVKNYDPIIALDGGEDGLKFYKNISVNAKKFLIGERKIFLEIGYNQGAEVKKLFEENGYEVKVYKDYSNLDRIVEASLK